MALDIITGWDLVLADLPAQQPHVGPVLTGHVVLLLEQDRSVPAGSTGVSGMATVVTTLGF